MTAAVKLRSLSRKPVRSIDLPVKANTKILPGWITCSDANGFAVPATKATGLRAWGPAQTMADNTSGGDGAIKVNARLSQDLEVILYDNDTATPLTAADVGKQAAMLDNQTLTGDTAGASQGPYVYEVTSEGVWAYFKA